MRAFSPAQLFRSACMGAVIILVSGCASPCTHCQPQPMHEQCPSKFSFHYVDPTNGFSLCLPAGLTKGNTGGYPSGTVLFNGFSVPAGTNLESKRLIIVPGTDPDLQGATADGHFTVDGVTFTRSQAGDGSAGHLTQFIIYTWTHGGKTVHFDFSLFSVDIQVFPPSSQPKQFDFATQVKFTEEVMKTFRRLH